MHLIVQTYSLIELQQLRSELEKRGIRVHVSDEFTYAIPGMPGAEQPRGIWIAMPEDILPAKQVVTDLVGADRLEPDKQAENKHTTIISEPSTSVTPAAQTQRRFGTTWQWIAFAVALGAIWLIND